MFAMFMKILKAALKDDTITEEEWKMLEQVDTHYGHYDKEFKDAVSDGFITPDECKNLRKLRNIIYENTYKQALEDGVITDDEKNLLKEIQQQTDLSDEEIKLIEKKVEMWRNIRSR